jgi:hypothetical protein
MTLIGFPVPMLAPHPRRFAVSIQSASASEQQPAAQFGEKKKANNLRRMLTIVESLISVYRTAAFWHSATPPRARKYM